MLIRDTVTSLGRDLRRLPRALARSRETLLVIDLTLLPWTILFVQRGDLGLVMGLLTLSSFTALYWLLARNRPFEYLPVRQPRLELAAALFIVGLWVLYRVGEYGHWYNLPQWQFAGCGDVANNILPKMLSFVLVPLSVLLGLHYRPSEINLQWRAGAWVPALVIIAGLLGQGLLRHPAPQVASGSFCFFWGAGLPEEFLFRTMLQTRLETILRRPSLGLFLASLVFGLSHLPILLNGSLENWPSVLLGALCYQMGAGVAFGFAYQRARSLWPVAAIHAVYDATL